MVAMVSMSDRRSTRHNSTMCIGTLANQLATNEDSLEAGADIIHVVIARFRKDFCRLRAVGPDAARRKRNGDGH